MQLLQVQLARLDEDGARLDLRQIEDVVDEHEQIVAGGVDRLGEFDLALRQIAVAVLAELVREDQQAIQRRAKLVRHVGEELRLVLGGQCQLRGLLFQRLARQLDLAVLALDFLVLVRE